MVTKVFTPVIALALALSSAGMCFARLGETEAELEKRYGKPFHTADDPEVVAPAEKHLSYLMGDTSITVVIHKGRSAVECYEFQGSTVRDNLKKAEALLQANSQGMKWIQHPTPGRLGEGVLEAWWREDEKATAGVFSNNPKTLEVHLKAFDKEANDSERRANAGADGF